MEPNQPVRRPPNLLLIVDDMGYSDCQPFGGEIRTPVLQKLAEEGVRFRNLHTSSLCAPTRSMLLSGVDNHQNGLGTQINCQEEGSQAHNNVRRSGMKSTHVHLLTLYMTTGFTLSCINVVGGVRR